MKTQSKYAKEDYVAKLVITELPKNKIERDGLCRWLEEKRVELDKISIDEYAEPYTMILMKR